MLDVRNKFVDFGEQLQPPPGYVIDYAVATTYSLDLYALLSIPLAIYYKQNLDSEVNENNFQILEAIQSLQKHLKIYCQKGKISVPKVTSISLLAFIENCVTEVAPSDKYQSFHPKVWVLRFKATDSKDILYRLIVMSRNLTFDKSYDIAYWMEGHPSGKTKNENNGLVDLLKKLNNKSTFGHNRFIRDLSTVDFKLCDTFNSYTFSSFPTKDWKQSIDLDTIYLRRMVVSPFLTEKMVTDISKKSKNKLIVFSRKNELDKLSIGAINLIEPYCFSQEIVDHHLYEKAEEGDRNEYNTTEWDNNLHAKIYLRENGTTTFWDLGSSNCSEAAFVRNHEFLIHLRSNLYAARVNNLKEALLKEHNGVKVFKEYSRSSQDTKAIVEEDFREVEYALIHCLDNPNEFEAWIESKPENRTYSLFVKIQLPNIFFEPDYQLFCKPIGYHGSSQRIASSDPLEFSDISLHKLSSFIHWQIKVNKTGQVIDIVTKAEIKNMPENRLSNILKSIIDNPDKFMLLLMALLTDEPGGGLVNDEIIASGINGNNNQSLYNIGMPVYEELLLNLSRSPERLHRLSSLIDKLNDLDDNKIVPEEFYKIWKIVKEILLHERMAR